MSKRVENFLRMFHVAAKTVPAYKHFLNQHHVRVSSIKTLAQFKELPIIDKKNYLYRYEPKELFPKGEIPPMAYASSGSSGEPTFWFRGDEQEDIGGKIHEEIFKKVFQIKKDEPTLVVVCFSMGVWIAGNYTVAACRYVARNGYKLTVISPGLEKEDIFSSLKKLAPEFKNLILAGYPPFIMDIVNESIRRKIGIRNKRVHILTAGDKFSEKWRSSLISYLHLKGIYSSIVSIYGSADAAVLGHETQLTIFLRRKAIGNKKLYIDLFDNEKELPGLYQYHPRYIYFEELNDELIFSTKTAAPLIRYNIHDTGKIIEYSTVKKLLKKYKLEKEALRHGLTDWKLPLVVVKGRTDVAVTFYAINIFPEHIKACLKDKKIEKFLTGSFYVHTKNLEHNKRQRLYIKLELAKGVRKSKKLNELVRKTIVKNLLNLNIEFRKLYDTIHDRALPVLNLYSYGERRHFSDKEGGVLSIKGKKPRVLISN